MRADLHIVVMLLSASLSHCDNLTSVGGHDTNSARIDSAILYESIDNFHSSISFFAILPGICPAKSLQSNTGVLPLDRSKMNWPPSLTMQTAKFSHFSNT